MPGRGTVHQTKDGRPKRTTREKQKRGGAVLPHPLPPPSPSEGREEGKEKARVGEELRHKNGGGETTHTQLSLTKSVCSQGLLFFSSFIRIQIKYK